MKYVSTKKETRIVEVVVRPSEVYKHDAKQRIEALLATGYEIVDFRPPQDGDLFIRYDGSDVLTSDPSYNWSNITYSYPGVRFIVIPKSTPIDSFWE